MAYRLLAVSPAPIVVSGKSVEPGDTFHLPKSQALLLLSGMYANSFITIDINDPEEPEGNQGEPFFSISPEILAMEHSDNELFFNSATAEKDISRVPGTPDESSDPQEFYAEAAKEAETMIPVSSTPKTKRKAEVVQ